MRNTNATGPRRGSKLLAGAAAAALLALGTGVSLASTRNSVNAAEDPGQVTCITVVDAAAAVDANTALSDVFSVGTKLHMTSADRAVDVTVSAPITAPSPAPSASDPGGGSPSAPPADNGNGQQQGGKNKNVAAAHVDAVTIDAADNGGVDPDTVCVKLAKNAFNTLGDVSAANNVGTFVATMAAAGGQ